MLSIYIPKRHHELRIAAWLNALGRKRDLSVSHLVVEATLAYLEQEEVRV